MLINLLMEYNRRALEIATRYPETYHQRKDFQTLVDERFNAQEQERKAPNEKPAS